MAQRGGSVPPQAWGVVTVKNKTMYAHITDPQAVSYIFIPQVKQTVTKAALLSNGAAVKFKQQPEGVFIYTAGLAMDANDTVIKLTVN
jgi:alpha-L-fucosidase